MFWILLFYLLYGSNSSKPETALFADGEAFANAINDPARLERVMELRGQVDALLGQQVEQARVAVESLQSLNSRHDADRGQFQEILARLDQERGEMQAQLLDVRFRIKEQMTEKEWQKAYGKQ